MSPPPVPRAPTALVPLLLALLGLGGCAPERPAPRAVTPTATTPAATAQPADATAQPPRRIATH
jgi:hypothetical protein